KREEMRVLLEFWHCVEPELSPASQDHDGTSRESLAHQEESILLRRQTEPAMGEHIRVVPEVLHAQHATGHDLSPRQVEQPRESAVPPPTSQATDRRIEQVEGVVTRMMLKVRTRQPCERGIRVTTGVFIRETRVQRQKHDRRLRVAKEWLRKKFD